MKDRVALAAALLCLALVLGLAWCVAPGVGCVEPGVNPGDQGVGH